MEVFIYNLKEKISMDKKAIDLDHLQKMTEKGRQRAKKRQRQTQLLEDQKHEIEAKKLSDQIIAGLPEQIGKKARKGSDSVTVYLPSGYQLQDRVKRNISSWCWANGLSVQKGEVHPSDDFTQDVLFISWRKEK